MDWPEQRVEDLVTGELRPLFCPNPSCAHHEGSPPHFVRYGFYRRKCDGKRKQRYRCLRCGRCFSEQTFAVSYYLKRPECLERVARGLVAGSAYRQLARTLDCSHSTVALQAARIGRHALLLQALCLQSLDSVDEPIVYDHFESFVYSQAQPYGLGTPVGQHSWFVYGLDWAPHRAGRRRVGRSRAVGREHRRPGAYARAFRQTLDALLARLGSPAARELVTDGHLAYRSGVTNHPAAQRIVHRVFPNPPRWLARTRAARRRHRAMFAVDLLHKLLRHSHAHDRRETIAFGRRLNAALERGFVFCVWRNLVKGRSERKRDPTTPAMLLGLTERPWGWSRVLAQRLFPSRIRPPGAWGRVYRRELVTALLGRNARHALIHAF
jgi:transposase-like protein